MYWKVKSSQRSWCSNCSSLRLAKSTGVDTKQKTRRWTEPCTWQRELFAQCTHDFTTLGAERWLQAHDIQKENGRNIQMKTIFKCTQPKRQAEKLRQTKRKIEKRSLHLQNLPCSNVCHVCVSSNTFPRWAGCEKWKALKVLYSLQWTDAAVNATVQIEILICILNG